MPEKHLAITEVAADVFLGPRLDIVRALSTIRGVLRTPVGGASLFFGIIEE